MNNKNKKQKQYSNSEKKEFHFRISLLLVSTLILIITFTISTVSINLYKSGLWGNYNKNYLATYADFMEKEDEVYYIYMYKSDCQNCEETKRIIVAYQRSNMMSLNAPLYTYKLDKDLEKGRFLEYQYNSSSGQMEPIDIIVGQTEKESIKVSSVPTLIMVRKQSGVNTVITYVKGLDAITKQLKVIINY
mgnify:CR=1 FL=1